MDFTEANAAVVSITKRPDKAVEIASNINKAISFFTFKGDFSHDLIEGTLSIDPTSLGQTIDMTDETDLFVRFRKMKFMRPTSQLRFLLPIDPTQLFTPGGSVQRDRYYIAGTSITFTLAVADSSLELGYYQYPPILEDGDSHWMLDMIPWAVIERAASQTFKSVGDDVSARFYEASSMEMFLTARRDFADQAAAYAA